MQYTFITILTLYFNNMNLTILIGNNRHRRMYYIVHIYKKNNMSDNFFFLNINLK